jgi:anti-sigma28 factor (negative regulator of flagellin synthesis)
MFARFATDDARVRTETEQGRQDPGMATSLTDKEQTAPQEDPTMTKLKTEVAVHQYSVDSSLVAEEILRKLRMIRWARHELVSESGRTRHPKLRGL